MDTTTNEVISDKLELHFIELKKQDFSSISETDIGKMFLKVLATNSEEELEMIRAETKSPEIMDLVHRIQAYNKHEEAMRMLEWQQYEKQRDLKLQQAEQSWKQAEQSRKQAEKITEITKKVSDFSQLFITEFYETLLKMPEHIKNESGGSCTPVDFFKVMTKSTVQSLVMFSHTLVEYIDKLLELDVTFTEIAAKVNADPADVQAFYEKFKMSEK